MRFLGSPEVGALCEEAIAACAGSFDGFAERGLGSLPGGEESVLVKGVRACRDAACPGYDILLWAEEKTDEVELALELSEPTPFKRSPGRVSWSRGECVVVCLVVSEESDAECADRANADDL